MALFKKSKDVAKERLRLILIHDRIELSPHEMNKLKKDLSRVISKYIRVDQGEVDMNIKRKSGSMVLEADIPIKSSKSS